MKKYVLSISILALCFVFIACNIDNPYENIDSETEDYSELNKKHREVVFNNSLDIQVNHLWGKIASGYEIHENEEMLYAFSLRIKNLKTLEHYPKFEDYVDSEQYYLDTYLAIYESLSEVMHSYGLYVIPNCSYYYWDNEKVIFQQEEGISNCVVAGTREQILSVFSADKYCEEIDYSSGRMEKYFDIDGWYLYVSDAWRPDYINMLKAAGWKSNQLSRSEWINKNKSQLTEYLGREEELCIYVPVITPEKIRK